MRTASLRWAIGLLVTVLLPLACGGDSAAPEPEPEQANTPAIPVPTSPTSTLPDRSENGVVGMSDELGCFTPLVSSLEMMQDDGSLQWVSANRYVDLACPAVLPSITAQAGGATYISARPRLLHSRYWRKLEQNTLSPGTSYTHSVTVHWGASTTDSKNRQFSQTIGVSVSVGGEWKALSASIEASYSQTSTSGEVHSVTFSSDTSQTRSFTVEAPSSGTRLYALWQLVDVFTIVDADQVPIDQSPTLLHVRMPAIPAIEFPRNDVLNMSTTDFK